MNTNQPFNTKQPFNMGEYMKELCGMDGVKFAKAPSLTHDSIIVLNSDTLAGYYQKYEEKARNAPEQCISTLQQELGAKFIELMERGGE